MYDQFIEFNIDELELSDEEKNKLKKAQIEMKKEFVR